MLYKTKRYVPVLKSNPRSYLFWVEYELMSICPAPMVMIMHIHKRRIRRIEDGPPYIIIAINTVPQEQSKTGTETKG